MLTLQWLLSGASFLIAIAALLRARKLSQRVERLTESYWDLRYEHTQLRAKVARLDPEPAGAPEPSPPATATTFVPLSSLKK